MVTTSGIVFLDFVHPQLCTISCDKPSSDGYEVANLISADAVTKAKGFLSERFITPPVTITLKFVCPLDISHIIMQTNVGTHKTLNLELLAKFDSTREACHGSSNNENYDFRTLAKACEHSPTQNLLYFTNHNYGRRPRPIQQPVDTRIRNIAPYRNTVQLQIRLTHTRNGHVPALGRIEVWGRPTRGIPHLVGQVVKSLQLAQSSLENVKTTKAVDNASVKQLVQLPDDIPSEFIDSISCDIMTLPLLLPSGHNVDQQTLEKYEKFEATNARLPNDPFTGLPFTTERKPILNTLLKSRIDAFLLSRPDVAKDVRHTVGRVGSNAVCSTLLRLPSCNSAGLPHLQSTEKKLRTCGNSREALQKGASSDTSYSKFSDTISSSRPKSNLKELTPNVKKDVEHCEKSSSSSFVNSNVSLERRSSLAGSSRPTSQATIRNPTYRFSTKPNSDIPSPVAATKPKTHAGISGFKSSEGTMKLHRRTLRRQPFPFTESEAVIISEGQASQSAKPLKNVCKKSIIEEVEVSSGSDDDVLCVLSLTKTRRKRKHSFDLCSSVNKSGPRKANKEVEAATSSNSMRQKPNIDDASSSTFTHEETLKNSLDLAMRTILGPLTSYTDFATEKSNSSASDGCCCSVPSSVMYQLPCTHRICRTCLLQKCNSSNQIRCTHCDIVYNKDQPVRIHV